MSNLEPSSCMLNLGTETLSAWRDHLLPSHERTRVEAHIAGCTACRARLADYERVAAALVAERVPLPDPQLWRQLRARLLQTPQRRVSPGVSRQALSALAAMAAVLLIVAGFARLLSQNAAQRPTAFQWSAVSVPDGVQLYFRHGLGISGADGDTAYACGTAYDAQGHLTDPKTTDFSAHIWLTHDRGQTWQPTGKLPTQATAQGCFVVADTLDPQIAIAATGQYDPAGQQPTRGETFATGDGGASWHPIGDPQHFDLLSIATTDHITYALRAGSGTQHHLIASYDDMQSWVPMDDDIVSAGQRVDNFWVQNGPRGPTLYAAASATTSEGGGEQLWYSANGGKQWTAISDPPAPATAASLTVYLAQASVPGQLAQICGVTYTLLPSALNCTSDAGTSWQQRALPALPAESDGLTSVRGFTRDGALVAYHDSGRVSTLYQLPTGASAWQSLGALPETSAGPAYVPAPGDGVFWLQPTFLNNTISLDPRGHLFTASDGNAPNPAPTATSAPTTPPAPSVAVTVGPTLAWQPTAAPPSVPGLAMAAAPSDGNTLYSCSADLNNPSAAPRVWVSRDRGASWPAGADIPSHAQASNCQLVVDANDSQRAVAVLTYLPNGAGGGPDPSTYQTFLTNDGARTWSALSSPSASWIIQLASRQGAVYAIRSVLESNAVATGLYVSTDGLRTWRNLTASLTTPGSSYAKAFWLDPATGKLLLQVDDYAGDYETKTLYASADAGQHWTAVPLPAKPNLGSATFAAQPQAGSTAWHICAAAYDLAAPTAPNTLTCTTDSGQHWSTTPGINVADPGNPVASMVLVGLADDGAALLTLEHTGATTLYALPAGSHTWQELAVPQGFSGMYDVTYTSGPGAGLLWAIPLGAGRDPLYVVQYP